MSCFLHRRIPKRAPDRVKAPRYASTSAFMSSAWTAWSSRLDSSSFAKARARRSRACLRACFVRSVRVGNARSILGVYSWGGIPLYPSTGKNHFQAVQLYFLARNQVPLTSEYTTLTPGRVPFAASLPRCQRVRWSRVFESPRPFPHPHHAAPCAARLPGGFLLPHAHPSPPCPA